MELLSRRKRRISPIIMGTAYCSRERKESPSMTQQEALYYAISVIEKQPESKAGKSAVNILLKMAKSCKYIKWTKESIIQTLDDWKTKHGRNPSVTDLSEPDMPNGATIKKLFDMKPSAFLNI